MGYPKSIEGFKEVNTIEELAQVTNAIILCDEIQKIIPFFH